jgi:hypothetical protein
MLPELLALTLVVLPVYPEGGVRERGGRRECKRSRGRGREGRARSRRERERNNKERDEREVNNNAGVNAEGVACFM